MSSQRVSCLYFLLNFTTQEERMQSRRKTIPESASTHLKHQKASGLSIAAYCRKNNINATTFYGWNKRYQKNGISVKPSEPTKTSFIEMPVKSFLQSGSGAPQPVRITHTEITIPVDSLDPLKEAFNEFAKALLSTNRSS